VTASDWPGPVVDWSGPGRARGGVSEYYVAIIFSGSVNITKKSEKKSHIFFNYTSLTYKISSKFIANKE
jgi:hypothetical protein